MVTIIKKPDALSFSGNLKEFVLVSLALVRFRLKQGETLLLDQSYEPGENNQVTIDVASVIENCLSFSLQEAELSYIQEYLASDFTAEIDDTVYTFRVIRGGIANLADTPANWLTQHFLTWQPVLKKVTYYSPEWLTYYAVSNCSIMLKAYFPDKTEQEINLVNCMAGKAYTVNVQYAIVAGRLGNKLPMYYDVYTASGSSRLSEVQRYQASTPLSADEEWVAWENSVGGYDTARVYGVSTLNAEHTHNIAQIGDTAQEYDIETERKYTKNTGHLSDYERRWFLDFFPSKGKYVYSDGAIRKIVVLEDSATYKSNELPSSYTFTYKFAQAKPLLNLPRNPNELPAGITIPVPGDLPDFILPPRLAEYPRLPLAEGVLLPAHDPHSDRLGATTFGALKAAIMAAIEDAATGNNANFEILKIWVRENFLSRITADEAFDIITFLRGIIAEGTSRILHAEIPQLNVENIAEFGDNVPGYTGAYINREGEAELKSLIVRTFLAVPEFRFNRSTVFKGRNWVTPGGGCVLEKVTGLANGTYFCKPKLEEGEPIAQAQDDIMEAFWHDKNIQTGQYKGFRQMWFRVASVDYDERTFILVPRYPESIAHEFMTLAQYGNFTNPERQTSILIDSTYGNNCILFLEGVNTWDIAPSMERSWLGKRKGRTVAGIDMDNYSGKLHNMVFSGKLFQVDDITGSDIRVPLDKGAWQENTRYAYYDRVSYAGSLWLCVCEAGTTNAPSPNEPDWLLQVAEGKPSDGFEVKGLWDKYSTYKKSDVVSYNGNSFVYTSSTPSSGVVPGVNQGGYIKSGGRQVVSGGRRVYSGNPMHPWILLAGAGKNATSYWLTSSANNIVFNSIGTFTPGNFTIRCKKKSGNSAVENCSSLYIVVRKSTDGLNYTSYVSPTKTGSITVAVQSGIKTYLARLYNNETNATAWNDNYIDEIGISVVADGLTGSMPRNCGQWLAAETYVWSEGYRDIVFYSFAGVNYQFQVKTFGASLKNVPPTSASGDANWETANKFKFVATDTLLADGANIAGFMYRNNKMQSQHLINQVAAILLDGINGTGHFGGGNFQFDAAGNIDITGAFRTGMNGNRIVISPEGEGSSIKLINKSGQTLLNIFFDKESGYDNYFPNIQLTYLDEEVRIGKAGIRVYNSAGRSELTANSLKIYQNVSGGYKLVAQFP